MRKAQRLQLPRRPHWIVGSTVLCGLLVLGGVSTSSCNGKQARRERLSELKVPADGSALYRFMLKQIPDVVSQVPCACCGESLAWCYRGGCPPT